MYTVYLILNKINQKMYIGKTSKSLEERWHGHLRAYKYQDYPLYFAMRKYGPENFFFRPLKLVQTEEEVNQAEQDYIKYWQTTTHSPFGGYNATLGGEGTRGTKETNDKISAARLDPRIPNEEVKRLYLEGLSTPEIADIFNCRQSTIYNRLKRMKIPMRRKGYPHLFGEQHFQYNHNISNDKILQLLAEGWSARKIAESFNVCHSTIIRRINKRKK